VQFGNFPQYVYKVTKTTDFFVTYFPSDTPVSEPWPLMNHVEFANLISGMAPHDIVYTKHLVTAILAKARMAVTRQQLWF